MNESLISIIVPVYNAEPFLARCLESLINQTYQNLEIICVNDGSTDNSLKVLREYACKDSRVRILDNENAGVSRARNAAMQLASGNFVMFADADDWIELNTCEAALNAMRTYGSDIVMWSYVSETENRSSKKEIFEGLRIFDGSEVKSLHRRFIGVLGSELAHPELADSLCPVWGKLYKREMVESIQFVDLSEIGTYEDGLFNIEAFEKADKVIYLPNYYYHYLKTNTGSVTSGYRERLYEQWQNLFEIMREYITRSRLPDEYIEALHNRIALSILGLGLNIVSAHRPLRWKRKEIARILGQAQYREAYQKLDLQYFPLHWKLFYWCARVRFSAGVLVLLKVIQSIISR